MNGYVFRIDLERELSDALREIDRLRVALTATENALRLLWTYYLLPISDEQAQMVKDALGEP